VRAVILKLLERGPIKQYELAKIMREITGKKQELYKKEENDEYMVIKYLQTNSKR